MSSCHPHNESVGLILLCRAPAVSRFLASLIDDRLPSVFHEQDQHPATHYPNDLLRFVDAVGERFLLAKWLKDALTIFSSGLTEA